ncbi:cyclic nucleotide-binding domain-containing protein [Spirillospora albida]|uniref:cyclic nucleotide-binding domain-containing protein n=1 Tax=Spirillospora albida TaxID=58123 RepID=UPI001B80D1FB|nr:cyclic nucleotide-binding domain-containing protein [Spirillospora albida]
MSAEGMGRVTAAEVARHPFFHGVAGSRVARLATAAAVEEIPAGRRIFEEHEVAEYFWLLRSGTVALDMSVPGRGTVIVETLAASSVLGWSWLFPPHRWRFGAVATGPVDALRFDGRLVRTFCAADHDLGYDLAMRFGTLMLDRLAATRIRLLDLYARPGERP